MQNLAGIINGGTQYPAPVGGGKQPSMSLDTFIEQSPKAAVGRHGIGFWLEQRPQIKEAVDRHLRAGTGYTAIQRWLVQECGSPFKIYAIKRYRDVLLQKGGTTYGAR